MQGGGSCNLCWTPAPQKHPKPRRKLLKIDLCNASGLTLLQPEEAHSSKLLCQMVSSNVFNVQFVSTLPMKCFCPRNHVLYTCTGHTISGMFIYFMRIGHKCIQHWILQNVWKNWQAEAFLLKHWPKLKNFPPKVIYIYIYMFVKDPLPNPGVGNPRL